MTVWPVMRLAVLAAALVIATVNGGYADTGTSSPPADDEPGTIPVQAADKESGATSVQADDEKSGTTSSLTSDAQSVPTPAPPTGDPAPAPQAAPPDPPEHSGFKALFSASMSDFASFPKRPSTWVILAGGGVGALAVHPFDETFNAHLQNETSDKFWVAGKWMGNGFVVTGAAVGMYAIGRWVLPHEEGKPRTNKLTHIGFDLIRSEILSQALVHGIKYTVQRDRPTGECCAFPSGHAASAFAVAAVLERHFGYRGSWPALVAASYVAMSRLHDNRHFVSDVVFGAAVGTASGWTVVGRHGRSNYAVTPQRIPGGMVVMVSRIN